MRSIWCTVWILGALLIVATLDAQPDPPAVNPSSAHCKVLHSHVFSCDRIPHSDSLPTFRPFRVSVGAIEACEPARPSERTVLIGQAADPSPPATPAGR